MVRVLLAHISKDMSASFVRTDYEILREMFSVDPFFYGRRTDIPRLLLRLLRADLLFAWFAWDHAYWGIRGARILSKPSILVTGGFDVVGLPEIGYGSLLNPRSRYRVAQTLKRATAVLAISESIRASVEELHLAENVRVVPLGFDASRFTYSDKKDQAVATVGAVTEENLGRKGIGAFIEIARVLPSVPFWLIGDVDTRALEKMRPIPPNVRVFGRVSDTDLRSLLARAKIYVQLSAHEGFGAAVAEAMLSGCLPIVSNRGALPEVVGDVGIKVELGDIGSAVEAVRTGLEAGPDRSRRCHERIVQRYSLDQRRTALRKVVGELAT